MPSFGKILTHPSEVSKNMYDNEKADYVFRVGGFFFFLVY
jgi:hypothetical protein